MAGATLGDGCGAILGDRSMAGMRRKRPSKFFR